MTIAPDNTAQIDAHTNAAASDVARPQAKSGKWIVQAIGAVVGIALLAWAINMALAPANRPAWEQLRNASMPLLLAMAGLCALSVIVNGVMFWATLRPVRTLPLGETIGVNAIATFLSILPFKLGLFVRSLVHMRRHGMPLKQVIAWMAAFAGLTAGTLVVLGGASITRGKLDVVWAAILLTGMASLIGIVYACGLLAQKLPWLAKLSLGADVIARSPAAVGTHVSLRVVDSLIFGVRFYVAAKITGTLLEPQSSLLLGSSYALLQAVAPAGTLGVAEAGTAGVGKLIGLSSESIAMLALVNTAAQTLVTGAMSLAAWIWLRPDKLRKVSAAATPTNA